MFAGARVKILCALDAVPGGRAGAQAQAVAKIALLLGARIIPADSHENADFVFFDEPAKAAKLTPSRSAKQLPALCVPLGNSPAAAAELAAALIKELCKRGYARAAEQQRAGQEEYENPAGERIAVLTQTEFHPSGTAAAARLAWAIRAMPVTAQLAAQLQNMRGQRVLVSLLLEPKTAALAVHLQRTGAQVAVFAACTETDTAVAVALREQGVTVFAPAEKPQTQKIKQIDCEHAAAALAWQPTLLIDDGSHLIRLAHTEQQSALKNMLGAAEETTSGVRPIQEMAARSELQIPVVAVNDARTKSLFDNRVGTGESCVFAIADTLAARFDRAVASYDWVIWGYGPVGEGTARAARALGARVQLIETDAVRALAAVTDGYTVINEQSLPAGDFIGVSATGVWHTVTAATMKSAADRAVFAVAGGIDDELALDELAAAGLQLGDTRDAFANFIDSAGDPLAGGVIAAGGGVNYTAAEGNPVEVMDLSFATQLAALKQLQGLSGAERGAVLRIDATAEQLVATAALVARGLTPAVPKSAGRPGGAAQSWRIHRFRQSPDSKID